MEVTLPADAGTTKPRPGRTGLWLNKVSGFSYLCLGDLAFFDATGADPDPLGLAVYQCLDSLQIHAPLAAGDVVGVRDIVTELRAFPADIAYLCHDLAPNLGVSRSRGIDSYTPLTAYRISIIPGSGGDDQTDPQPGIPAKVNAPIMPHGRHFLHQK